MNPIDTNGSISSTSDSNVSNPDTQTSNKDKNNSEIQNNSNYFKSLMKKHPNGGINNTSELNNPKDSSTQISNNSLGSSSNLNSQTNPANALGTATNQQSQSNQNLNSNSKSTSALINKSANTGQLNVNDQVNTSSSVSNSLHKSKKGSIDNAINTSKSGSAANGDVILSGMLPNQMNPTVTNLTAPQQVNKLSTEIADKILSSVPEDGKKQEIMIVFKTEVLPNTSVKISKDGDNLNLVFNTSANQSANLLSQNEGALRAHLQNSLNTSTVNIQIDDESHVSTFNNQQDGQQGQNRGRNVFDYTPESETKE